MAEPVNSTAPTTLASITALTMLPGIDVAVLLGSFAGAAVFALSSDNLSLTKRLVFFLASFIAGCLTAEGEANLIASWLPIQASPGVNALITSALAVKMLLWLINLADDPAAALRNLKGRGK